MYIGIVNHSSVVSDAQAEAIAEALDYQLRHHACPMWKRYYMPVHLYADAPKSAFQLVLFDDADQQGVLGYHDTTPSGMPYGRIFAGTVLDYGGSVLSGALSVSATASHEAVEIMGDLDANFWSDYGSSDEVALELCDPVEDQFYNVFTSTGAVSVSNFVLPAWFDHKDVKGPYDYLGSLTSPLSISRGGYLILRSIGAISYADKYKITPGVDYPDGRQLMKLAPAARTGIRLTDPERR